MDAAATEEYGGSRATTTLVTASGETISYRVCNRTEGMLIAGIGGLFVRLISTGLGEPNGFFLMRRCRVPSKVSVATSAFVAALTAVAASVAHFVSFARAGGGILTTALSIVIFTLPGVIVGAQVGSLVASRIPQRLLERFPGDCVRGGGPADPGRGHPVASLGGVSWKSAQSLDSRRGA